MPEVRDAPFRPQPSAPLVAYDTALPHLVAPSFKLWFHQHNDLPSPAILRCRERSFDHRRQHQGRGDERHIHHHEIDSFAHLLRPQIARIGLFQQAHSSILPQTKVNLSVASIDGDHTRRPALQQAIGKSAG